MTWPQHILLSSTFSISPPCLVTFSHTDSISYPSICTVDPSVLKGFTPNLYMAVSSDIELSDQMLLGETCSKHPSDPQPRYSISTYPFHFLKLVFLYVCTLSVFALQNISVMRADIGPSLFYQQLKAQKVPDSQ